MMQTFGPDKRHWVPGHEEVELALVRLADATGDKKYLDFAHWLLKREVTVTDRMATVRHGEPSIARMINQ